MFQFANEADHIGMTPEEQLKSKTMYMIGSSALGVGSDTLLNAGNQQSAYMYLDFNQSAYGYACIESVSCSYCGNPGGCLNTRTNFESQWRQVCYKCMSCASFTLVFFYNLRRTFFKIPQNTCMKPS